LQKERDLFFIFVSMNKNSQHIIFVIATLVLLVVLLIIQINWIISSAIQEELLFNQKVELALSQAANTISKNNALCENVKQCMDTKMNPHNLKKINLHAVDSIIKSSLKYYHINLDFQFEFAPKKDLSIDYNQDFCYFQHLEGILQTAGYTIKLKFPDKNQFIRQQIGGVFILSVIIILFICASFIFTLKLYRKQRKTSENIVSFVNNLAHEIKTPLANIGFANSLLKKNMSSAITEKVENYLTIIDKEKNKLQKQMEEILEIANIENQKNSIGFEKLDLHHIIKSAAETFEILFKEKNGTIIYNLYATKSIINGCEIQLINLIQNLLDNSSKYNALPPVITFKTSNFENSIIMEISDNGIGIETKFQKLIFEKYYRIPTGDIHNVKGYGLGLAYVKMIVEKHKGTISLSSEKNKGTIFRIEFQNIE